MLVYIMFQRGDSPLNLPLMGFRGGHPSSTIIGIGSLANQLRSDQLGHLG